MSLRRTPTWRLHTNLYKFVCNVMSNNSTTEYRTDMRLGKSPYLFIVVFIFEFYFDGVTVKTGNRAFSLTWPAAMQIYWNKRKFLHKKRVNSHRIGLGHNMAAVSLFWDTNMVAVTSCENTVYPETVLKVPITLK